MVAMELSSSIRNIHAERSTAMNLRSLMPSILVFVLLSPAVMADVLTIPDLGNQTTSPATDVIVPERGMTMEDVSAKFGNPLQIKPPVGDPPITRWVYDRFTVHFEHNYVIHTVVHRQ
jgi:hypothetical protein